MAVHTCARECESARALLPYTTCRRHPTRDPHLHACTLQAAKVEACLGRMCPGSSRAHVERTHGYRVYARERFLLPCNTGVMEGGVVATSHVKAREGAWGA